MSSATTTHTSVGGPSPLTGRRGKYCRLAHERWHDSRVVTFKRNGYYWVAPDGVIYQVGYMEHDSYADDLGTDYPALLNLGFARVALNGWTMEVIHGPLPRAVRKMLNEWAAQSDQRDVMFYRG